MGTENVEPKLAPGQLRTGPPLIDPERADMIVKTALTTAKPAAPTVMGRVQDLETEVMQQNAHILLLHRLVDQCVDQVQELRHQLGMEDWKPQVRVEDNP